jgi:phosphohistidine phosphatase
MIVYFLRHASAGKKKALPSQDEKRPLDKDGVLQCHHIGRLLSALDVEVEVIVSSPLKRATQTAALVANEIGYEAKIELDPAMRPTASFDNFRALLQKNMKRDAIMVVGHNPSITGFLSSVLSDGASDGLIDLKKGAVARVEMKGTRLGLLTWCITPRIARAVYEAAAINSRPKTSRK